MEAPDPMPSLETLRTWLSEAYAAQHALALGQLEVTLSHTLGGTNSVTFHATDDAKLERHIMRLNDLIAIRRGRGRRAFYVT